MAITIDDQVLLKHLKLEPGEDDDLVALYLGAAVGHVETYYTVPEPTPKGVQAAVLLMVGDLYAKRETGVVGTVSAEVKTSLTVENLLAPFLTRLAPAPAPDP